VPSQNTEPEAKPGWRATLKEYGWVFFATLMVLWVSEWALWSLALWAGVPMEAWLARWGVSTTGNSQWMGVMLVAFAITQVTKPPRIAITVALTPAVAKPMRRWREARR